MGGPFGGIPREVAPPNYVKTMSKYYKISTDIKKSSTLAGAVQKSDFFGAPFWGGSRWSCQKKFREKKLRLQLNNSTQKLKFDVSWFRRRKKKEKKKEINLIAARSGLVGIKRYRKTFNHTKYFLPYLSRF